MPLPKVSLREDDSDTWRLEVDGYGYIPAEYDTGDDFVGPRETLEPAGLTSLRTALIRRYGIAAPPPYELQVVDPKTGEPRVVSIPTRHSVERGAVLVVDVGASKFHGYHTYEFLPEPVALVLLEGGALAVRVSFVFEGDDEPNESAIVALLAPLLEQSGSTFAAIEANAEGPLSYRASTQVNHPDFWAVQIYIAVPTYGRAAAFALAVGSDVLALLEAAEGTGLTSQTADALVASGRPYLLIGQSESDWLECKQQAYAETEVGKYELAKDVAAFANSTGGGLILIGLRTRKVGGRDTIQAVAPIPSDDRRTERYRRWIAGRVHPRITNLTLQAIEHGKGSIIAISVPAQPPALQPFMVKGLLRDGRIIGSHVAVYSRDADSVGVTTVEELHALLVAGRAALGYAHSHRNSLTP